MLINYYKGEPNTYVLCHRNGKLVQHGVGINFFYLPATTSIAAVPLASRESLFIFNETTANFQEVSIQGSLTYRLTEPLELAKRLDFTIAPKTHDYKSDDPQQLEQRVVNSVQAHTRSEVSRRSLEDALSEVKDLASIVFAKVAEAPELRSIGIELEGLHFTAVKATPEMQKALEADYRESLHKRADQAIYDRRKSAVDEERKIRESEMNTDVELENRRKDLVDMQAENSLTLAEAEAKADELKLAPYGELPPQVLIGLALKEWASNAGTIENLSITPDLLSKVVSFVSETRQ
ncbi:MAG: SPFH domain-containing protein [Gammaproteobacteria bacterium]|nr:SPFH domain-containing protein [Gammaproteobacteria bacterium]MDH3428967.1 SPFH domain-containing protein [Gammaproteobacteria bacterium]MDH3433991.1 SPFH domain-containing protein [Gammaproteobacteria bacterium]